MKKLLLASVLGVMALPAYAAVDCQTLPSCADLGYTYSASDCKGVSTVKCPFDKTKLFCNQAVASEVPPAEVETVCAPGMMLDTSASKCYEGYSLDRNSDWLVLATRSGKCTSVGFTAQPALVVEEADPTKARTAAVAGCKSSIGNTSTLLSTAELEYVLEKTGTWIFETANNFHSGDVVTKDGCYDLDKMAPSDCNLSEDFAYVCQIDKSCNATGVSAPEVTCSIGSFYNSVSKTCKTSIDTFDTPSDYFIVGTNNVGRCTVIGAGFDFGTRMDNSNGYAHADAKSKAEQGCHDQYGDSYDLPTMAEVEYMVKSNATGPFEGAQFQSGVVVASDGCINISTFATANCANYDDLAYVCKHAVNNCGATKTASIPVTNVIDCAQGAYYDPTTRTCSKTETNYLVVSMAGGKPRAVDLTKGYLAYKAGSNSITLAEAEGQVEGACKNIAHSGVDVLTDAELQYLFNLGHTWPFEVMNTKSAYVLSGNQCFNLNKNKIEACPSTAADYGFLCRVD